MRSVIIRQSGFGMILRAALVLVVLTACQGIITPSPQPPMQLPTPVVAPAFADCRHDYEGVWYCVRQNGRYRLLYADLSNPSLRVDVVMARYSTNPQDFVAETVDQMARRYADRFPGFQVVAGINANYFGPGHHGPQGLVKATTRQGGPSQPYITLFSPYLNSGTHDYVELISSLGISPDRRVLIDRDFYNQHADFIGGSTGEGRALTGGPRIIWQGEVLPEDRFVENCNQENLSTSYCTQVRPRAALGTIGQQGLVLTVGQADMLRNTALLLQQHGVDHAMKLDDGTSAQLWYVDDPFIPRGGGGSVANALLIYSRPLGEPGAVASSATALVMDISGSMDMPDAGGATRKMDAAINAAQMIVDMIAQENEGLGTNHQLALVTFNGQGSLDMPLTPDLSQAKGIIAGLYPDDGTNMAQGLTLADNELQKADPAGKRIIILLSDGVPTVPLSGNMSIIGFTGEMYTQLKQEIMAGPVAEATRQGYCIYTVGFGDPTESETLADGTVIYSIDTEFLRQISTATGCGQYYNAIDAAQLANVYIKLRHESVGQIIGQFSGQVAQGERTTAQRITVPENQGELYVTLNWPGSSLDLILTDPNGRTVDENYPGARMVSYARFVYLIITNPLPGLWQASVYGREVPEGTIGYNAVFSVRAAKPPPPPSDHSALIIALTIIVAMAAAALIVWRQPSLSRRTVAPTKRAVPFPSGAGVRVMRDYGPGEFVGFRGGILGIGRDPRNELVLSDDRVSRNHAQIRQEAGGYVIYDQGSTNGTFVNGQQVASQVLRDGDEIRIGDTRLIFQITT